MDCNEVRELLAQQLDGRHELKTEQALARHLATCLACRQVGEALMDVDALLARAEPVAAPESLGDAIRARVHRRARVERIVRNWLIAVLSIGLIVVGVVLPAMRAAETSIGSAFVQALGQLGAQALDLLRAVTGPLVTIAGAALRAQGHPYAVAYVVFAMLLVVVWLAVVSRITRPRHERAPASTTSGVKERTSDR